MCALRVTDPFDPEPAAAAVPQPPWPQRAQALPPADAGLRPAEPSAVAGRCWRRYARPAALHG
ncbi:hypothetical protein [Rubrivivax gelatinosus]|uniref:Uncharacterized protein n=1 Tax=Rubrivivax gelatinosus TaxID=28068 RepID=A0A4R2MBT3_RUBGE|nr:hypothetical protein [Rubrivivax gelatinosus]TCP03761.1 hypothetical protein EV684_1035 [Rubrivivax gelatinosus]